MSFSINQAILVGNCARNPELRYTPNKVAVLNFSIATNRSVKNEQAEGGYEDVATFHNVIVFGKIAEWLSKNLIQGQAVTVYGRIDNSSYEKDGVTKYSSKIIAEDVIPHRSKKATAGASTPQQEPDLTDDWTPPEEEGEPTPF